MSKPKKTRDDVRYYRPVLYGRPVKAGEEVPRLRIYHPPRRANPGVRRILHPEGERVIVRAEDTYYWKRLELQGDIETISESEVKKVEAAAKKKAEVAAAEAKKAKPETKDKGTAAQE